MMLIDDEELHTFDSLVQAGVFVESWTWLDVLKPGSYLDDEQSYG